MDSLNLDLLVQAALAAIAVLSPIAVAAIKAALAQFDLQLPAPVKPLLNVAVGILLAGLSGQDPSVGVVGALVGAKVRDALAAAKP